MRKNQLQQFSLKSLIVLGLLLLVFTCQKEDDLIEEEKHTAQITSQNFTATVFRKSSVINTTPKLKQHIDKILSKENNSTKRTITSQEYGFSIDTTKILQLQSDYYTSYIFIVERENQQEFVLENYIITQFADNTIKQYLVNYPIHTDGSLDIAMAQLEGLEGQGLYLREGTTCYTFEEYEEPSYNNIPCHGQGASGEHTVEDGDECDYWGNPNQMATVEYVPGGWISHEDCISGGGSGGGITDPISGGGTVDPTDYDQPVIPVFKYTWEKIELCINGEDISPSSPLYGQLPEDGVTIEPGLIASLNLPEETLLAIDSYLIENNCSEEAQEFTVEAMQALMDGSEVDFEDKLIYDTTLQDCVKNIIDEIKNSDNFIALDEFPNYVLLQLNISNYILDLFENSNNWKLTFKSEIIEANSNGLLSNAKTNAGFVQGSSGMFYVDIILDSTYVSNATDLAIARTVIHELVHAYILYTYQTDIFSDLSQSYSHLLAESGVDQDPNSAQHQLMVNLFINAIADSLANWDNYSISNSVYYEYLSWSGGMTNTETFSNKPIEYKANVINANLAEGNAGSTGAYNQNEALGVKNCN
ncbi:hypothetical protein [Mesoflavibacter sp. CH_XMU1404-2]|uniref:hypothetical protein n=1 Tax=Mesoflavibacter sp. CH_XMU1404-2 TaxID=3107766 RepID=UPI00300AF4B7